MRVGTTAFVVLFVFGVCMTDARQSFDWDTVSVLDEYVNRFDPHYRWEVYDRYDMPDFSVHVLNMTSQKWMDETYTNQPIWWHFLTILVPHTPRWRDAAYIYITGGSIGANPTPPGMNDGQMRRVADMCRNVGVVSAYLSYVPFQPQHFVDSPNVDRVEDLIIAHTWKLYIEDPTGNPNPDQIAQLPMTKAAKKALDTIHDYMAQEFDNFEITKFMPSGISKRGWVTWLLGCVDKRVFAMTPTVFDLLDIQRNLEHHYRSMGGWSWAFAPYWIEDVSKYLYHPTFKSDLEPLMDPLYYNPRLTMPKLISEATGDEFFLPDGSHYFFDVLNGNNYMHLSENDNHGQADHIEDININFQAFFIATYTGFPLPQISWERRETATGGSIVVRTNPTVVSIGAWVADTTNRTCEILPFRNGTCRRDFRLLSTLGLNGIEFVRSPVTQTGIDQYIVEFDRPDDERFFRAFFIEMFFAGPDNYTFRFTTELHIIPDTFPYAKCETEAQCRGILV